ncbi:MAG: hypothetical protein ACRDIF_02230 [Actinomycetota bacterium]
MGGFKKGILAGFAAGYLMGAKAGRERYEQIMRSWTGVKSSPVFQKASGTASAALGAGLEKGKLIALRRIDRVRRRVKIKRASAGR